LIISKCFYTSLNLAFQEDGFWRKKVQTNKMRISILTLGEIFVCQCLLNWANAIFIPSLLWPTFYPYHQCIFNSLLLFCGQPFTITMGGAKL
jgi:hypothetical protein